MNRPEDLNRVPTPAVVIDLPTVRHNLKRAAAYALRGVATAAGISLSLLVDLGVGHHRTGVQTPADTLILAQHIDRAAGVHFDGVMIYPGHLHDSPMN